MANDINRFQAIISHCKEYGFIFPSSEIYDGLSAVYDYGQYGSELKKNIKDYWWKSMTQLHENIVGIDAAIFMHPTTWKASGHIDNFSDPMIDNKDSKKRYRVDHLIEGYADELRQEANLILIKLQHDNPHLIGLSDKSAAKDADEWFKKESKKLGYDEKRKKADDIEDEMNRLLVANNFEGLKKLIENNKIKCKISGTINWTDIRQFNLMFSTQMSAVTEDEQPPTDPNELILFNLYKKGRLDIKKEELPSLGFSKSVLDEIEKSSAFKSGYYVIMISVFPGEYRIKKEERELYLRPETAQGIFVNFLNVQKTGRMKIPFGIAQIGKAFRNEIVARQFIFRMREFEQMEMQFFIRPGSQKEWYEYWKEERMKWHLSLGIAADKYKFHDHVKLAHYADAACDIEYNFPIGFKEVEGIHSRTDFDLRSHQEYSKKKMQYFDNELDENGKPYGNYIPYVIETSIGLDRTVLMILSEAYYEEDLSTEDKQDSRVVLKLPPMLAPVKLAIFPLTKKDGLPEIAKAIMDDCKNNFRCFYEEKDAIGKRYRRMDAIGTPFCITIDHQTKEDNTVTLRHRDSMQQERIAIHTIKDIVDKLIS